MDEEKKQIDARIATRTVKEYFHEQSGPMGVLFFKVESVRPNSQEGVYYVRCGFYSNPGANKPSRYEVKVNINTGNIINVEELKDE